MNENNFEKLLRAKVLKEEWDRKPMVFEIGTGKDKIRLEVEKPDLKKVLSIVDHAAPDTSMRELWRTFTYELFEELHSREVLEEHGRLDNPEAIIDDFFTPGDIEKIGRSVFKLLDGGNVKVIKN